MNATAVLHRAGNADDVGLCARLDDESAVPESARVGTSISLHPVYLSDYLVKEEVGA